MRSDRAEVPLPGGVTAVEPGPSQCEPIYALARVVDLLASLDPAGLPDESLSAGLLQLLTGINQLEAQAARWLAVVDERGLVGADGALSTQAWLTHHLHIGRREAHRRVRSAAALVHLPEFRRAWEEGRIRSTHVEALARMADTYTPEAVASAETTLLRVAGVVDGERFAAAVRNSGHIVDPQRHERDAQNVFEGRHLHVGTTYDGKVRIDGLLDPEAGAAVMTAINALAAPGVEQEATDRRTPAQRRADALTDLCRHALDAGLPEHAGERPHITILVPLDALSAPAGSSPQEDHARARSHPRLEGVDSVPTREQIRRLLCDAQVSRVITEPESMPLDVGRTRRTVTPAQRRALRIRDGCCRFPGCRRPFAWTDAHHIVHWADGGPTDLDNLISLCRRHHRHLHEEGWRVTSVGPGRYRWRDPLGNEAHDPDPPGREDELVATLSEAQGVVRPSQ